MKIFVLPGECRPGCLEGDVRPQAEVLNGIHDGRAQAVATRTICYSLVVLPQALGSSLCMKSEIAATRLAAVSQLLTARKATKSNQNIVEDRRFEQRPRLFAKHRLQSGVVHADRRVP